MNPIECTVLIIDDEESDRYFLKRMLRKAKIQGDVFEASDGQQALDFLLDYEEKKSLHGDKFPPQAILLDINMPIMNGFEFLESFSQISAIENDYHTIVFAMITSSASKEDHEKATSYSCVSDYITKDNMTAENLNELFRERLLTPD